ncbi:MAG: calcium-translocating P-type ATPase, PMCA-type, partial [Polyangia bacterium]|nr:calcium-translocating P-type ATPase, PMCA-type [Polyangia bacterium]
DKIVGPPPAGAHETAYPPNVLLRGTTVADGHGVMRVTAVGDHTEIGHTARAAAMEHGGETPLNSQLERLSKLIGVVAFGVAAMLFGTLVVRSSLTGEVVLSGPQTALLAVLGVACVLVILPVWLPIFYDALELLGSGSQRPAWLEVKSLRLWLVGVGLAAGLLGLGLLFLWLGGVVQGNPLDILPAAAGREYLRYFMVAVTVIVVAVPEGLAMSVTLSLAYSMRRMTATHNLVRRMHACETIGATTVICSDKTGTLTMNEMRVVDAEFPGASLDALTGELHRLGPREHLIVEAASVNSTANLSRPPGEPATALGVPTEGALLLWLESRGIDYLAAREPFQITDQLTFSPVRKYMATLGISLKERAHPVLHVKGAPEVVLGRCSQINGPDGARSLDPEDRAGIETRLSEFQRRGMRVLGFGHRLVEELDLDQNADDLDLETLSDGLTWLGFTAIADPVRPDVAEALKVCRGAGIDVKMVTGDNSLTAAEIGRQIGLMEDADPTRAHITGPELTALDDEDAMRRLDELRIISRARPADKLHLVELLRRKGAVVAVTGDGTNDGPALNLAHVGLAMGKSGTSVAKEASDIILLDDSFTSIANAAMWGRSLYQNIQRFVVFQLTINVTALLTVLLGPFIGVKLPLTVTQMLWVNLIMDTFAALALAAEPPHPSVMRRPPRDPKQFILTKAMATNVLGVGVTFFASLVVLLLVLRRDGVTPYELTVFFTTFVFMQLWNLFNARALGKSESAFAKMLSNRGFVLVVAVIAIGQVLIVEYGGSLFRTVPLELRDWLIIVGATSAVLWVGEGLRALGRLREASA